MQTEDQPIICQNVCISKLDIRSLDYYKEDKDKPEICGLTIVSQILEFSTVERKW